MSVPPVPRRAGASLAERAATTAELAAERAREQDAAPGRGAPASRTGTGPQHCWVTGLPAAPGRWPGLLTAWRRQGAGWEGLVTYALVDGDSTVQIQSWIPAEHLRPV